MLKVLATFMLLFSLIFAGIAVYLKISERTNTCTISAAPEVERTLNGLN